MILYGANILSISPLSMIFKGPQIAINSQTGLPTFLYEKTLAQFASQSRRRVNLLTTLRRRIKHISLLASHPTLQDNPTIPTISGPKHHSCDTVGVGPAVVAQPCPDSLVSQHHQRTALCSTQDKAPMTLHQQASARHGTIESRHGCRALNLTIRRALSERANIGPSLQRNWLLELGRRRSARLQVSIKSSHLVVET